ncbi:GD21937 [Drosophila simulans]|uniref:GD21937 n=1 Tax=Drosophila simulans TaxID=7240 RepID=B4Q6I4_DROSI|nr:GD21937 [Drosophila simulans]
MSPKFALAILLLSCVLLGLTNAQYNRRHQAGPYRQNIIIVEKQNAGTPFQSYRLRLSFSEEQLLAPVSG